MKKQSTLGILNSNYYGLKIKACNYNKNTWEVEVLCFCGNSFNSTFEAIKRGRKVSCGCKPNGKTGVELNPCYNNWRAMIKRCYQPTTNGYKNYGKRGIAVCSDWQKFEAFETWALANGYLPGLQIDRINNNGNYEPENCRWVTAKENASNKRNNVYVELKGAVLTTAEASRQLGHNPRFINNLIAKNKNLAQYGLTRI